MEYCVANVNVYCCFPPKPPKPKPTQRESHYNVRRLRYGGGGGVCLRRPTGCISLGQVVASQALDSSVAAATDQASSDQINLESVLVSMDDFLNRYPFFVAGLTLLWLVVIPLTQRYLLNKVKPISALDAFRKLRDDPNSHLLDIRHPNSRLSSPTLDLFNKTTIQLHFQDQDKDRAFVNKVLQKFTHPSNTTICVVDNFDGNSMKVAELLFESGFREAYAIKGGLRGKDGWQAIQETLLPSSMHVFSKKDKASKQLEMNGEEINKATEDNVQVPSTSNAPVNSSRIENVHIGLSGPTKRVNLGSSISLSPYPNYPDMKPPSSPTPSKPLT